jgi:beta-glucosidase
MVTAFGGHQWGNMAPGIQYPFLAVKVCHHLLFSHGMALPVIRRNSRQAEVGITLNLWPIDAASSSRYDLDAQREMDGWVNRWYLDPLYGRHYPADMVAGMISAGVLPPEGMASVQDGDLEVIAEPADFLGINFYFRSIARSQKVPEAQNYPRTVFAAPEEQWTEMKWEIHPDSLYRILCRLHFDYQAPKIYITENGASYSDAPDANGVVDDQRRLQYLQDHFTTACRSIHAGVPLAGYFVWSLLYNFEWAFGYTQRFGIIWVDYATQQRILKNSARWYRDVIAANGVVGT